MTMKSENNRIGFQNQTQNKLKNWLDDNIIKWAVCERNSTCQLEFYTTILHSAQKRIRIQRPLSTKYNSIPNLKWANLRKSKTKKRKLFYTGRRKGNSTLINEKKNYVWHKPLNINI
jgi:hypothetical protein